MQAHDRIKSSPQQRYIRINFGYIPASFKMNNQQQQKKQKLKSTTNTIQTNNMNTAKFYHENW